MIKRTHFRGEIGVSCAIAVGHSPIAGKQHVEVQVGVYVIKANAY